MRPRLFFLLFLLLPVLAAANGDPVTRFSSVTSSGNPIPMQVSDVKIVHEQLVLKPGFPYTFVEVRYTLQNLSEKAIQGLDYGFPIDFEGPADSSSFRLAYNHDSIYETGWRKEFLRDIAFSLDGKPLEWHSANEIVEKERIEIDPDGLGEDRHIPRHSRMWTYTQLDIAPGATVDLEVRYSVYHEQYADYFGDSPISRFFSRYGRVTYDLTPAKHWGDGKAGTIDILLDGSRLPEDTEYKIKGLDFVVKDGQRTFHADSFDYAQAPEISLNFDLPDPKIGEPFPAWVDIDSFLLPASAYKITQTEFTIDLEFSKPVPVTDISFFNGNTNDADAWEREARAADFNLEIQMADGDWRTWGKSMCEQYQYRLHNSYIEAAGVRLFLCVTDILHLEGIHSYDYPSESYVTRTYDNRIRHIRITVTKLTKGQRTGKNPLKGIRVYAYPKDYEF